MDDPIRERTTEQIRASFAEGWWDDFSLIDLDDDVGIAVTNQYLAEFNQWLARHDQEVASAAIAVAESGIGMADGKHDCDHVIHVSPEQFAQIIGEE